MIRKATESFTPKHYLVELLFSLTAIFGFYLIIAWSSYSPFDSAWSVSSYQTQVLNKAGSLGAWVIDLFFVLFGYVGNLLPFLLCIAPIYFIRTKRVDSLTWTRFTLRMFGFSMLMLGLTSLASLLLQNSAYYLSGGVLGGSLVQYFLPLLGKFGLLLFATSFALLGFVFCSGASLIRLLVRFYHWLTMKNEPAQPNQFAEQSEQVETSPENVQNAPHLPPLSTQLSSENIADLEPQSAAEPESPPIQQDFSPTPNISIVGLTTPTNNVQQQSALFAQDKMPNVQHIDLDSQALPPVSIVDDGLASTSLDMMPEWKLPQAQQHPLQSEWREDESTVQLAPQSADNVERMPEVKLQPAPPLATESCENSPKFTAVEQDFVEPSEEQWLESEAVEAEPLTSNGLRTIPVDKLVELYGDHKAKEKPTTALPTLDLLDKRQVQSQNITQEQINETSRRIEQQLQNFRIKATVKGVLIGPVVTRYELELQPGIKASKVSSLDTDLARALAFKAIRVTETIPGKPYIGIETPNKQRQIVPLLDVLDSDEFRNSKALLPLALGKDISGSPIVIDLAKTPHLLVAGSTGSGKSVGINTMILSLLFRVKPEEVKFIMIDPKVVELSIYNDIPHLLTEVVTDMKKAANALRWCVDEMERRYQLLSRLRVRNIEGFNERIDSYREEGIAIPDPLWKPGDTMDSTAPILERMSYIVVIVDEFADLMMQVGKQIEELIARLTQKARAVGIHVILATQRPSVDVITGLIKSNIPSRIAFTVVQRNDSRTILDQNGAEALLGMGDMLYLGNGTTDLVRVHGAFMSDDEVARVADDWRARGKPNYISSILENSDESAVEDDSDFALSDEDLDPLFDKAVEIVVNTGMTSTSFIQRRLKIGFNRAANIMDQLEEQGIVSEMRNGKRELLSRSPDF